LAPRRQLLRGAFRFYNRLPLPHCRIENVLGCGFQKTGSMGRLFDSPTMKDISVTPRHKNFWPATR
jgi:hypothetical protein